MDTRTDFEAFELWLGVKLAPELVAFIAQHGGGYVNDSSVLYAPSQLTDRNECYETKQYCPGWITIGVDGGPRQFVVAPTLRPAGVFAVDGGDMTEACFELVAPSLSEWKALGFPDEPAPNNSSKPKPLRGSA